MKLKVPKGELTLPENFSFEIEQNSAFFSEDGAASLATTIPATPEDLAKLDQPTRIARDYRFANLFPVVLSSGTFVKKGTLVITNANEDNISCAIALEDSDFYSRFKEKNVKDIFAKKVITEFASIEALYLWCYSIYIGARVNDLRFFPVAVNYDSEKRTYQVNNEPIDNGTNAIWPLLHEARVVKEGGDSVNVPEGYGIAPFLKLYAFFETLFELCGYTVRQNCFRTNEILKNFVLLHNCSDVLCNGHIDYSDLVPNKSVAQILDWMRKKFHAQIMVHPESASVDILLFEEIIAKGFDLDLSKTLVGALSHTFHDSSRLVLSSDTSLEGATPAAETPEDLLAKYGSCHEVSETGYACSNKSGLIFRRATGQYYEKCMNLYFYRHWAGGATHEDRSAPLGSNYFKYDRRNSKDVEDLASEDLMPPMVIVNGMLMPYVGQRKHRNSSFKGSERDEEQEIIICDYAGCSEKFESFDPFDPDFQNNGATPAKNAGGHYCYGTTQKYDNAGRLREGRINMNSVEMFPILWRRYNKILLNNRTEIEGLFDLPEAQVPKFNMYSPKLFRGQRLLPVSLRYAVGRKVECLPSQYLLLKDYRDASDDTPTVIPEPMFEWRYDNTTWEELKERYSRLYPGKVIILSYSDDDPYLSGEKTLFLIAPTAAGQTSPEIDRTVEVGYWRAGSPGSQGFEKIATEKTRERFVSAKIVS